jgi:MSHA biogenesis protein MshJ
MATALKLRWQAWATRFAALQQREKVMVSGAVAVAILFGGFSLWIEPGQLQTTRLKKSLEQQLAEQAQLSGQLVALAAQNTDPNAANRATLEKLREQLADAKHDLKAFDRTLIAPTQASSLLQTLLTRHRGLKLVSLATLAPLPLIEPPVRKESADKGKTDTTQADKTRAEPPPPPPGNNIYKHGVEIRVAGSYHDLLAYVADLEAGPQKLLWGDMRLTVKDHPVSELSLTVFTLSLEATWLVV